MQMPTMWGGSEGDKCLIHYGGDLAGHHPKEDVLLLVTEDSAPAVRVMGMTLMARTMIAVNIGWCCAHPMQGGGWMEDGGWMTAEVHRPR